MGPTGANRDHCEVVGLLVAYQHARLDTILLQGFHQPVGSDGSSTDSLGSVDYKDSHKSKTVQSYAFFTYTEEFSGIFFV